MDVKIASAQGLAECKKLLMLAKAGKYNGYLLEGMGCPGGCIGGGGQPRTKLPQEIPAKRARIESLYGLDALNQIRASWENPEIQTLYTKFLGEPLSDLSESLLHTQYINKHYMLGKEDKVQPGVSH